MKKRTADELRSTPVAWREIEIWDEKSEQLFRYEATVGGRVWRLRVNDFPDEPLYTLFVDGEEIGHLDDFPPQWSRPES